MEERHGEILIYQTEDGLTKINAKMQDETVWLSQQQLAELYQSSKSNVSEHIKHIFEEGELDEESVVRKFRTTASDGKNYSVIHYNLDMIISLGYRIKSSIATRFMRWATERIKEYMIKGFTMDDERLKGNGGGNYWKELLDRIKDIRSSEKVLYRQVLDLYATSVDYNPNSEQSILSPVEQAYMETIKDAGESAKKGLGNKHFSLVICSQGKNVNYIDVKFPPLFISLPEILLWKKLKGSGLQITMWSIRFENIETIIKGEVQYPRLKFVLIIETIRLLIRLTGYIKEKHEEIPKQRGSIGHISGK